ncbi:uncharacterized protein SPPG_07868 [Spizellomyces punctatus DAOM BR117]|uniref:Uncharacterized protein n=1 Tax=Spizellomyces punctatus (strain DAOM BR117) TaxID=645134 RepID=A0A0L0H580_SPIPD|nr:uncharacterized protein SPPG_07868 [Spizellomyces punctatus DAOM BR117]KNC96655.1 hypothetical protein SPPG_07868 [Spizellomyces punctatus DAOM BR117]|eukprot:XP_016604695.1 hypothetical protein SPPG_07868 [Spizellomyces punctatus DAOM BR117]
MSVCFSPSAHKSAAQRLVASPIPLTRTGNPKFSNLRLPFGKVKLPHVKKQASYILELDGDDNAGSELASEAEPVINDQRIAHDDDGASQLASTFERYQKTLGSEQMRKVSDIYEERLSQVAETLQGFLDFQDTQLTRLYAHKRKISEVTEEQINTRKKLRAAFDRHQVVHNRVLASG